MTARKYILLDANVTAAFYLPHSTESHRVRARIENIFNSAKSGETELFFYLPNFCVAEVFSTFMKYRYGKWNKHVRGQKLIDARSYKSLVNTFQDEIHNANFIYHYELSRYHILGINLIAPIDHHYPQNRSAKKTNKQNTPNPMSTFDALIISMGIHLAKIHGEENVVLISADNRLTNTLKKCKTLQMGLKTRKKLHINEAEQLTGLEFKPKTFPKCINLNHAKQKDFVAFFGVWPLPVKKRFQKTYRYIHPSIRGETQKLD